MTDLDIFKLCSLSVEVKEFFNPLIARYGITYASHIRLFDDGRAFELGNNSAYLQHFLEKKYAIPAPGTYTTAGMHLWASIPALRNYDNRLADMRECFKIDHQVGIIYPGYGYIDRFALGASSKNPEIVNFYINNRDILDNIFLAYKDHFADLIDDLSKQPFRLPLRPQSFAKNIPTPSRLKNFSPRELECMELCAQAKTSKMIGYILAISPRTVEKHLENIKLKLGLRSKFEIANEYQKAISTQT